jgi:hypothetical protein
MSSIYIDYTCNRSFAVMIDTLLEYALNLPSRSISSEASVSSLSSCANIRKVKSIPLQHKCCKVIFNVHFSELDCSSPLLSSKVRSNLLDSCMMSTTTGLRLSYELGLPLSKSGESKRSTEVTDKTTYSLTTFTDSWNPFQAVCRTDNPIGSPCSSIQMLASHMDPKNKQEYLIFLYLAALVDISLS